MNDWNKKQAIEDDKNEIKIDISKAIDIRIQKLSAIRQDNIRKEMTAIKEILSFYERLKNKGLEYDEKQYEEMLDKFNKLQKEMNEIVMKHTDLCEER